MYQTCESIKTPPITQHWLLKPSLNRILYCEAPLFQHHRQRRGEKAHWPQWNDELVIFDLIFNSLDLVCGCWFSLFLSNVSVLWYIFWASSWSHIDIQPAEPQHSSFSATEEAGSELHSRPVAVCQGFMLFTGLLRVGEKTHAWWFEAAGRRKKKPYVPSDVINAKNYLFSLCIHGEIVSMIVHRCASGAFEAVSRSFKWHVTVWLYCGLFTDLGSVFSVVVQGAEALWFFMVALSIDVLCERLLLPDRFEPVKKKPRLCCCGNEELRFIWCYRDLFFDWLRPPHPPFHRL